MQPLVDVLQVAATTRQDHCTITGGCRQCRSKRCVACNLGLTQGTRLWHNCSERFHDVTDTRSHIPVQGHKSAQNIAQTQQNVCGGGNAPLLHMSRRISAPLARRAEWMACCNGTGVVGRLPSLDGCLRVTAHAQAYNHEVNHEYFYQKRLCVEAAVHSAQAAVQSAVSLSRFECLHGLSPPQLQTDTHAAAPPHKPLTQTPHDTPCAW